MLQVICDRKGIESGKDLAKNLVVVIDDVCFVVVIVVCSGDEARSKEHEVQIME